MRPFHGVSAFPITPTDAAGRVDTEALCRLVSRAGAAGVASVGVLGSTGGYAYLTRSERRRAVAAAAACLAGNTSLMVGVGALRTDEAQDLARDAEAAGADALLLAPMSYTPLTQDEVGAHCRAVARVTGLPMCLYNNPVTTHFTFGRRLLARLAREPTIQAVKMPFPADGDVASELAALRPTGLAIGYSGDWFATAALLAKADAWYSVLAGLLPRTALRLARAAQAGRLGEVEELQGKLAPLWEAFKTHGSLRVVYALYAAWGLGDAAPPRPILPLDGAAHRATIEASAPLRAIEAAPANPA